jgi:hypothetical protein
MRYHEIASGLKIPISGEEQSILDMAQDSVIQQHNMDERGQEVIRRMVTRGLVSRHENGIHKVSTSKIGRD